MYQHYAQYYDWEGSDAFGEFIATYIKQILIKRDVSCDASFLDLGCGTATTAIALMNSGFSVTGVDASKPMLEIAREKAKNAGVDLALFCADMVTYAVELPVDVVISTYDSVNHVHPDKLIAFFKQCADNLKPEGVLMFDMNTLYNYQTHWQGKDTDETENARVLTESVFDPAKGLAKTEVLIQAYTEDDYTEMSETIEQYYFTEDYIKTVLADVGFSFVTLENLELPFFPSDEPLKQFVTAKKSKK